MNKTFKVNYLAKDYSAIREELTKYAKRYYSTEFSDLSDASLNSFLIDSVAYVGDVLSYYLDFQTNESFLSTAIIPSNVAKLAKSLGYKLNTGNSTSGKIAIYMLVPSDGYGNPDYTNVPIIKKRTVVKSADGLKKYMLNEDVIIDANLIGSNYVVARTNNVGNPTFFAVKTYASIVSGEIVTNNYPVGSFEKFKKLLIGDSNLLEIISVVDSDGNEYYEVPNLTQNIIYKSFLNTDSKDSSVRYSLKPMFVMRRFTLDTSDTLPYLIFGNKEYAPSEELSINPVAEPQKFVLEKYNNDFLSTAEFEPNYLLNNDGFGIGPSNTTLSITYRKNTLRSTTAFIGEIVAIDNLLYEFPAGISLDETTRTTIINSVQIFNEEEIVGSDASTTIEEVKDIAGNIFQSQNRAVTGKDYEALCYSLPKKFGSIKRVKAERDSDSLKNNINLYVVSSNPNDNLVKTNIKIKENLKNWLNDYKMVTDSVDILDAKVINLVIKYFILVDPKLDKEAVRTDSFNQLKNFFSVKPQIGENFSRLDVYRQLRKINGILDVLDVKIENITSNGYSTTPFNVEQNYSNDKNIIIIPKNAIYEIRFPDADIVGTVK